jgi:hypothetical protein
MNLPLLLLAQAVGSGRIQGGWSYVWTSYGIAWSCLTLYSLSLWWRTRSAEATKKELP